MRKRKREEGGRERTKKEQKEKKRREEERRGNASPFVSTGVSTHHGRERTPPAQTNETPDLEANELKRVSDKSSLAFDKGIFYVQSPAERKINT